MDELFGFVSVIVFGCGIYSLYAYFQMKKTGNINETLLLGKSYAEHLCRDKKGFLEKAMPAVLVFSLTAIGYGAVDMVHCYVTPLGAIDTAGMILFLAVIVWFMAYTTKLKKKFWGSGGR